MQTKQRETTPSSISPNNQQALALATVNQSSTTSLSWMSLGKAVLTFSIATGVYALSKIVGSFVGDADRTETQDKKNTNALIYHSTQLSPAIFSNTPLEFDLTKIVDTSMVDNKLSAEITPVNDEMFSVNPLFTLSLIALTLPRYPSLSLSSLVIDLLMAKPVMSAYPTVENPIPNQQIEPGQEFSLDFDLNHIFNDADGGKMVFSGIKMSNGSGLPVWLSVEPNKLYGENYNYYGEGGSYLDNNTLCVPDYGGLLMLNVSNPGDITIIGSFESVGTPSYGTIVVKSREILEKSLSVAHVLARENGYTGIDLIDVTDPTKASMLGLSPRSSGLSSCLSVFGDFAYLGGSNSLRFKIVDVGNPYSPVILGSFYDSGAQASTQSIFVDATNNIAHVLTSVELILVNVTDKLNPSFISKIGISGSGKTVQVEQGVAYLSCYDFGLQLVNVTDPSSLSLLGSVNSETALDLFVKSSIVYLKTQYSLNWIDVTNAVNPVIIGNYTTTSSSIQFSSGSNAGLSYQSNLLCLNNVILGLQFFDLSDPAKPVPLLDYTNRMVRTSGVQVNSDVAYVSSGVLGFKAVNVTDPSNPWVIGSYETSRDETSTTFFTRAKIINKTAYVTGYDSLLIMDVSNPESMRLIKKIDVLSGSGLAGIEVDSNIVFLAEENALTTGQSALTIFDINNTSKPILLDVFFMQDVVSAIKLDSNMMYISTQYSNGLQIIDISNLNFPTLMGSLKTNQRAYSLSLSSNIAYLATSKEGIKIVDVADPMKPVVLKNYTYSDAAYGGYSYLYHNTLYVSGLNGLKIIDVRNATNPSTILTYDGLTNIREIDLYDGNAYIASYTGLHILDMTNIKFTGEAPLTNDSYKFTLSDVSEQ